jgi:Ca2+-binding EF-hand superfamily protein
VAGSLNIYVDKAKGLTLPEELQKLTKDRFDPYVQLTLDGKAVQMIKRTPADKDGGKDPNWGSTVNFMVVDQYNLDLKVFNQSVVSGDTLIGFAEISLLNVFRNGVHELWTTLMQRKSNGGIREVGDIFLKLSFLGPVGIAYPQCRPEIDSYDTLRKAPGIPQEVKEEAKPIISTITIPPGNEDVEAEKQRIKELEDYLLANKQVEQEFTEEEIIAAFKFIDIDHNNFVGAAEIRHILVCMGEMITDEEIDMMISMVDLDGDGQVSFKEFRALVLHPNPGLVDIQKEINKMREDDTMKDRQAMTGKANVLELASFQRQKELLKREEKKKRILTFIDDNEINFEYIKQSYGTYTDLPTDVRVGGRVKFTEFRTVMKVEPITEYRNLHSFYDDEEMGDMDMREFLLNIMNFVPVDKEERIRFSFDIFDEAKTGFIGQQEVQEILRGNHILTMASVERKAETIMKQANKNLQGAITVKEFLVISRKFPNIMFPTAGITMKK